MSNDEILIKVIRIVSDALRISTDKIRSDSKIFSELGAESLDIIDIRFRLEKVFGFTLEDGEIIRSFGENLIPEAIDKVFIPSNITLFVANKLQTN